MIRINRVNVVCTLKLENATKVTDGQILYDGEIPTFEQIGVDFDDGVFQDRSALLKFYGQAKTFGLIPTIEIIQRVFKVPKDTAKQWLEEIDKEQPEDPMEIEYQNQRNRYGDEE